MRVLEAAGFLRVTRFRLAKRPDPRYPANLYRLCLPVQASQLVLENAPVQAYQHGYSEVTLKERGNATDDRWTGLPAAGSKGGGLEHGTQGQEDAPERERAMRPVDVVLARIAELRAERGRV